MKEAVSKENQITHGVIWKQLLVFFFPILLGTFFQQIYNTADTVVVGRFVGTQALAAVGGSTSQIINLIVGFFTGLASGATVVISQHYGAKDQEGVQRGLRTAYAFSIVGGVIVSILSILLTRPLLELLNTPEDIIDMSATYLCIYFAGLIFVFIYNVGAGILRAVGDSRRPLYFLIVCCFINIVLDIVLVVFFHMGVAARPSRPPFPRASARCWLPHPVPLDRYVQAAPAQDPVLRAADGHDPQNRPASRLAVGNVQYLQRHHPELAEHLRHQHGGGVDGVQQD